MPKRRRVALLDPDTEWELNGMGHRWAFCRDEDRPTELARLKALWKTHRDEMVTLWQRQHPGSRPWAWWEFERGEGWPGVDCDNGYADLELPRLLELGEITDTEIQTLLEVGAKEDAAGRSGNPRSKAADVVRKYLSTKGGSNNGRTDYQFSE
jgi:hypothetical protein